MSKAGLWKMMAALAAMIAGHQTEAQTLMPPSPKDFLLAISQGDQYEVLAARLAAVQSQDPRIRAFAQKMIQDHARLGDALHQAATASRLPMPEPGMSSDQAALLSSLQSVRGVEFDKAYVRQQVLVHAQAIAVQDSFARSGSDPNLRQAAQSALPSIQDHMKKAQQLNADIGGF